MQTIGDIAALRTLLNSWRQQGHSIALVPTMGNLHPGHLSLMQEAKNHATRVVASIFVNPLQFLPGEDYAAYPRTVEHDSQLLRQHQVDALFLPTVEAIYPKGQTQTTVVEVPEITAVLCGARRPGHFSGVSTVVCKLFNIVQPDVALFGEKDYQQLLVIRQMVDDLNIPVKIVGVTTLRESDGLAMSSRNQYLSNQERQQAAYLSQSLVQMADQLIAGGSDHRQLEQQTVMALQQAGFQVDYVAVVHCLDLKPSTGQEPLQDLILLGAASLGQARLIDNLKLRDALKKSF